jgi:hypothetical protein
MFEARGSYTYGDLVNIITESYDIVADIHSYNDIFYTFYGIFVTPRGVLMYGWGGTTDQQVAPLHPSLVDAGYYRPYLSVCTSDASGVVIGPALSPDLAPGDISAATTSSPESFLFSISDDVDEKGGRGGRVYGDGNPDTVAPSVNTGGANNIKFGDEYFTVNRGSDDTTQGPSNTRTILANSGNAGVLYGLLCGGVISGTLLFFLGVSMYCRRSNRVISIAPLRVEPSRLPSSLDLVTGLYPQCRNDGGITQGTNLA